jgi:hypothetical protein
MAARFGSRKIESANNPPLHSGGWDWVNREQECVTAKISRSLVWGNASQIIATAGIVIPAQRFWG